jgi:phage minor structural protein
MYAIYVDGQLLYSTAIVGEESIILSPKLSLDVNSAGSLSFTIPPTNRKYDSIKKLKSIITVEQDGELIFRGRALDDEVDFYRQKKVYCEGDRSFLMDSVQRPYEFSGKVRDLFKQLITKHNEVVETEKRFTVGTISAVNADETLKVACDFHSDTESEIESKLLDVYGGYLKTRTSGNTHYIDWVKNYGGTSSQAIEFSVNLLDLKEKIDATSVFTALIPLGATEFTDEGEYTDPLTVESVNNGKDYIQDDDAVALFGKIWRTMTWDHITDASALLAKGREYLETGIALNTITLKAIDLHFVDANKNRIKVGDKVRILSNPHGIDQTTICSQIDVDLLNPEKTSYTFGEPPKTLTDNVQVVEDDVYNFTGGGGGGRNPKDEIKDIIRWAKVNIDEQNATIQLTTGELDKVAKKLSAAEIKLDGVNAQVNLAASRLDDLEGRVSSAEITLDGALGTIDLKVSQDEVISAINLSPESITINSKKINLSGYVTASQLSAEIATINQFFTGAATAQMLYANSINGQFAQFTNVSILNYETWWFEKNFVTDVKLPLPQFKTLEYKKADGTTGSQLVCIGFNEAGSVTKENRKYLGRKIDKE